jgi:hypothetical protein
VMNKKAELPVEGKAIRFAPGRDQEPAASFWKVWTEGNELYALARNSGGLAKISVHASGQIHYRLGPKLKQDLTPLMQLSPGPWFHAFEIRFLLSQGTNPPLRERQSLRNKSSYVIPVPKEFVLYANLIVGSAGTLLSSPLPVEFFPGGKPLWQTRLRDGRPAILVGRILELDSQNRDRIKYIRETLKPTVTVRSTPSEPYVELHDLHWSPEGGNVVLVVPMGDEAVRTEQEEPSQIGPGPEPREFRYQSPRSTADIIAPNGLRVAVLELDEIDKQIELVKNWPSTHGVGALKMQLEPANLIAGSKFMASPCKLLCTPSIGGASPRAWEYTVFPKFDGFALSAEIRPISTSLQNKNLPATVNQLEDQEELVMSIPSETLELLATIDAPATSTEVLGRLTWRDRR